MTRWVPLALGLALGFAAVAVAAWVWVSSPTVASDEIGASSRAEMERVLRENP